MKILAAFDSFKESVSAYGAGEAVVRAVSGHEVLIKPMADGGEGTMEAMNASLQGTLHEIEVTGPLFTPVKAKIAICDDLAVIECAQACGLDLLEEDQKDGIHTTTYGVGEMVAYAYKQGAKKILITLGGSSTNDGGIGMLEALGIRFLDEAGKMVKPCGDCLNQIVDIDISQYLLKDKDVEVIGACDVTNPLIGGKGATYVFGPQKGVKDLEVMDLKMSIYARETRFVLGQRFERVAGAGAAGGLGFAIVSYMNGRLSSGFNEVARITELEEAIKKSDIVFTGEGSMDRQTLYGKTPLGVLQLAQKYDKPVVAFAGRVQDEEMLVEAGFKQVRCINHEDAPLSVLLSNGAKNLEAEVRSYLEEMEDVR